MSLSNANTTMLIELNEGIVMGSVLAIWIGVTIMKMALVLNI